MTNRYLQLLQQTIIPRVRQIFPNYKYLNLPTESIWFQQDGAPPHFGRQVCHYLSVTFPGTWIGRRRAVEWPVRLPDLTPLDFFLGGYVKIEFMLIIDHNASTNFKKEYSMYNC